MSGAGGARLMRGDEDVSKNQLRSDIRIEPG
jgi:hypothetical protein